MFVSNRTIFLEKEFLKERTNITKIERNEFYEVEIPTHIESDLIEDSNSEPVEVPLRRSDRVPHQSDRYYNFLMQDGDLIELDENDEDLITYIEAMQRLDS